MRRTVKPSKKRESDFVAQLVTFLTHVDTPAVRREIEKLRDACQRLGFDFVVLADGQMCCSIDNAWPFTLMRFKYEGYRLLHDEANVRAKLNAPQGSAPLAWHTFDVALLSYLRQSETVYQFVWLIEYDVRFSGDWAAFLGQSFWGADLVVSRVNEGPVDQFPWVWWESFRSPRHLKRLNTFCPLFRLSGRMAAALETVRTSEAWAGHTEAILPTVASAFYFTIATYGKQAPSDTFHLGPSVEVDHSRPNVLFHPCKSPH